MHSINDDKTNELKNLTLAPFIQQAASLIDVPRLQGSNTFRHQIATFGILLDYGYTDEILLKASVIHDLIEDCECYDQNKLLSLENGNEVLNLVLEVSRREGESKIEFLTRIFETGSKRAKILKSADRISNMIDIGFLSSVKFIEKYIIETKEYILPMTKEVNEFMVYELEDLIISRNRILIDLIELKEHRELKHSVE
jgi:GTP pyrophosphokinase